MRQKLAVSLLVALALAAAAFATVEKTSKPAPDPGKAVGERTVSLDYKMEEIQVVFKDIARQAGTSLKADPGIGGKVSLTTKDAHLSKVMDLLCQNFHCTWSVQKGNPPTLMVNSRPPASR